MHNINQLQINSLKKRIYLFIYYNAYTGKNSLRLLTNYFYDRYFFVICNIVT